MTRLVGVVSRTLRDALAPEVRRVVIRSALLLLVGFAGLWTLLGWVLSALRWFSSGWMELGADVGLFGLGVWFSVLAFPMILPLVVSLFQEGLVRGLAGRLYPELGDVREVPFAESLRRDVRFLAVALGVNLLALPLYLFPLTSVPASVAINGYLLGREMFSLTASLFEGVAGAEDVRLRHSKTVWVAGAMIAGGMLVPVMNLFVPALAGVLMLHLFAAVRQA